jgi:hypothetical protein
MSKYTRMNSRTRPMWDVLKTKDFKGAFSKEKLTYKYFVIVPLLPFTSKYLLVDYIP